MQIKTYLQIKFYLQRYRVSPCRFFSSIYPRNPCAQLYVLYYKMQWWSSYQLYYYQASRKGASWFSV